MANRILIILLVILSANSVLLAQEIKFPYYKFSPLVEYSNYEKIEREMRRAAEEKKDRIVAVYRIRTPYLDLDERGLEVKKTKVGIYIMLYAVEPFEVLNRVDYITVGDKKFAAPQGTIFPELYFTEKEFDEIEDGVEIIGYKKLGKLDKKALTQFPIVEAKSKRN
jgi:hypothetical protein